VDQDGRPMALELAGEGGDTEEDEEVANAVEVKSKQRPTIGEGKRRAQAPRDLDSGHQQRDREPHLPIISLTS
jgi:hypothetical protein